MAGRNKLPIEEKKVQVMTCTMFKPEEIEKLGGKPEIKARIKKALDKEFKRK